MAKFAAPSNHIPKGVGPVHRGIGAGLGKILTGDELGRFR